MADAGTPAAVSTSAIARARRHAKGSAAACASTPAEPESPPPSTATFPPARRVANCRSAASESGRSTADCGRNATATCGAGRGVAGAVVPAGIPANAGNEGGVVGKAGTGPLTIGVGGAPGAAGYASSLGTAGRGGGVGAAAARIAAGAGAAADAAGTTGNGAAVAASIRAVAAGAGVGAGTAAPTGAAAGAAAPPFGGVSIGNCSARRDVRSRSEASRADNARRVAASVGFGLGGTEPTLG